MLAECTLRRTTGVLNLATGVSRSLNEVAASLSELSPRKISVKNKERKKEKLDYAFDVTNLTRCLGPLELTAFSAALKKTYDAGL